MEGYNEKYQESLTRESEGQEAYGVRCLYKKKRGNFICKANLWNHI